MSLYKLFRAAIEARITAARFLAYTSLLAEKASFELKAHAAEKLNRNLMIVLVIAVVALVYFLKWHCALLR
jgi:hypothetical protein